jgi:stalled ribosome rescue protein Dom34
VKNALHPAVRKTLVAVESIDFKQADIEIARKVKEIGDRYELEHDLGVVDELVARYNRNGTAVVEAEGVALALKQGRVKTLVIPYPIDSEQFDALIIDATTGGASIEFVYGEAAEQLKKFGGIGATLFYSEG